MVFPRQEDWSGLPFPSPGDFPDSGTEPAPPALVGGFFTTESPGRPTEGFISSYLGKCPSGGECLVGIIVQAFER